MIRGTVTHATTQGLRPAQEDRFVVARLELPDLDGWLLAVLDGHNGDESATICAERLEEFFRAAHTQEPGHIDRALRETVRRCEHATRNLLAGSSISVACVDEQRGHCTVAIVGDSPALIRDARGSPRLGPVHNAGTNPEDRARAISRGAVYEGGYLVDPETGDGVALTRALGDQPLWFLDRTPELFETDLGAASFVLLATDGLYESPFDLGSQAEGLTELIDEGSDAERIVAKGAVNATDNVTAVLWRA